MNIQSIRVFLSIVEHKSISAAARSLYYTQPTVSEHLNQLEKKLGVQLLHRERGNRQVVLTPAGLEFVPLAQRWLDLDMQTKHFAQRQNKKVLRLAASSAAHEYIVSHITQKLMRIHPELEVRLSTVEIREMQDAAAGQNFDAAFVFDETLYPNVRSIPFFNEERYVLCPRDTVFPDRLLLPEDLDPGLEVVSASTARNISLQQWRAKYFPEGAAPYFMVSSMMSVHNYLKDPRCWALVPASVALLLVEKSGGALACRRVETTPPPRSCRLLILNAYPHEDVVDSLLQCCDEYIQERPYLSKQGGAE